MDSLGNMQIGWELSNWEWYYLYSDGAMASNTVIDGYKLDGNGAWVKYIIEMKIWRGLKYHEAGVE